MSVYKVSSGSWLITRIMTASPIGKYLLSDHRDDSNLSSQSRVSPRVGKYFSGAEDGVLFVLGWRWWWCLESQSNNSSWPGTWWCHNHPENKESWPGHWRSLPWHSSCGQSNQSPSSKLMRRRKWATGERRDLFLVWFCVPQIVSIIQDCKFATEDALDGFASLVNVNHF